MPPKVVIHLICKAHIDPVWLWPWTAGLDEIINTCETICGLLERNRDVIFTRGEAWVYEQIEQIDPKLFARIKRLIARGQWEVVGGWYIQPDCNLPSEEGLRKQLQLGREYFTKRFGRMPDIAFNVDSFGHAPVLPRLMREFGQRYYVMMRPQEHEMKLPARLFRWRGTEEGPEVLTFRIAHSYTTFNGLTLKHLEESMSELPAGVGHTMAFVGVGDHGGGPTQDMIDFCRANRDAIAGARLEFSSPSRFFRAVRTQAKSAPLVVGELQHHAVGCYSVYRPAKVGVRRGEHALSQAEEALRREPSLRARYRPQLDRAWQTLCFNHFHDALGGTCLPSAHAQLDAQLGGVRSTGEEITSLAVRAEMCRLPAVPHQRLVIANYTGFDFDGWLEHEPWLEWTSWKPDWALVDEQDRRVPHQVLPCEAVFGESPRLLFKLAVAGGTSRVLRIASGLVPPAAIEPKFSLVRVRGGLELRSRGHSWSLPKLKLVRDTTDTWAHGVDRFGDKMVRDARWNTPRPGESGPLMTSWHVDGRLGQSRVALEVRQYAGEAFVEMRLRIVWLETHRLLRVAWAPGGKILKREDGVSGGGVVRPSDGAERPVRDRTVLTLSKGRAGAVFPEIFSISATDREMRLTLLRSAVMAHHVPHSGRKEGRVISDHGSHSFILRFYPSLDRDGEWLDRQVLALQRQPAIADLTKGMPQRALRGKVQALPL